MAQLGIIFYRHRTQCHAIYRVRIHFFPSSLYPPREEKAGIEPRSSCFTLYRFNLSTMPPWANSGWVENGSNLSTDGVKVTIKNGDADRRSTRRRRCDVRRPLVGLRVVAFDGVQVALPVVAADSVEKVVEDCDADTAASFWHRGHHLPVGRLERIQTNEMAVIDAEQQLTFSKRPRLNWLLKLLKQLYSQGWLKFLTRTWLGTRHQVFKLSEMGYTDTGERGWIKQSMLGLLEMRLRQ